MSLFSLGFNMVQGFAHLSSTFAVVNTSIENTSTNRSTCYVQYSNEKIKNAIFHRTTTGPLSASQDDISNQGEGEEAINTDNDDELSDDYDFEAGFQARLKQEGGRKGVQAKAAKRSVDSATKVVTSGLKQSRQSVSLLSTSEWSLTVGFLVLVVVLAVGTHFASSTPFETSTNGEQLGFGVR
jgi:hypothetical protein